MADIDYGGIDTQYERDIFEHTATIQESKYRSTAQNTSNATKDTQVSEQQSSNIPKDVSNVIDYINTYSTANVLPYINGTINSINATIAYLIPYSDQYTHSITVLNQALTFWGQVSSFMSNHVIDKTNSDAITLSQKNITDTLCGMGAIQKNVGLPFITNDLFVDLVPQYKSDIAKYRELSKSVEKEQTNMDSNMVYASSVCDFNYAAYKYSIDAGNTCNLLYGAYSTEKDLLDSNASKFVSNFDSSTLSTIADSVTNTIYNESDNLTRICNTNLSEENVNNHLNTLDSLISYKTNVIPSSKSFFRQNTASDVDINVMMMQSISDDCQSVENKYDQHFKDVLKIMSSENKIMKKVMTNDLKANRFNYISNILK